jgi:hypothetical protein
MINRKVKWILQDVQINLFLKECQLLHKELLFFWHAQVLEHHNQHHIFWINNVKIFQMLKRLLKYKFDLEQQKIFFLKLFHTLYEGWHNIQLIYLIIIYLISRWRNNNGFVYRWAQLIRYFFSIYLFSMMECFQKWFLSHQDTLLIWLTNKFSLTFNC